MSLLKVLSIVLLGLIVFGLFVFLSSYVVWMYDGDLVTATTILIIIITLCGLLHSFFTKWNKIVIAYWVLFLICNILTTNLTWDYGFSQSVGEYMIVMNDRIEGNKRFVLYSKWGIYIDGGEAIFVGDDNGSVAMVVDIYDDEVMIVEYTGSKLKNLKEYDIVGKSDDQPIISVYDLINQSSDIYKHRFGSKERLSCIFIDYNIDGSDNITSESSIEEEDNLGSNEEEYFEEEESYIPAGLLYKGTYTISGQGQFVSSGDYTVAVPDMEVEIAIYEDYLEVLGEKMALEGVENGKRIYEGSIGGFKNRYIVYSSFEMYRLYEVTGPLGNDWVRTEISKGESLMPRHNAGSINQNNSEYDGNQRSNSNNGGNNPKKLACRACLYTNGKCSVCNGDRQIKRSAYGHDVVVTCDNCRGSGRCPVCGGDGWIYK